jgi:hypothetical protein
MALAGFTAINEASLDITSSAQSRAQADAYLLASATDKVTYWTGWGIAEDGTIVLGAVAVALAPAAVVVTIGAVAITAKAATAAGTVALVGKTGLIILQLICVLAALVFSITSLKIALLKR